MYVSEYWLPMRGGGGAVSGWLCLAPCLYSPPLILPTCTLRGWKWAALQTGGWCLLCVAASCFKTAPVLPPPSSLLSPRHGVRCLCSQDIYLTRIRTSQTLLKSHDQARCQVYSPPVEPVVHFITRDSPTVPVTVTLGVSCDIDYRHTSPCTHMTGTRASQAWSKIWSEIWS